MTGFGSMMRPVAEGMITAFGGGLEATLTPWTETPNPTTGDTSLSAGTAITAPATVERHHRDDDRGHKGGDVSILVSSSSIGVDPPIDGSWTIRLGNDRDYPVVMPVEVAEPDGVAAFWRVTQRRGGPRA